MQKELIELQDISKTYDIGGEKIKAISHAFINVRQGEFVGIVGPSGSGKSTLMNIIGCLDVADSGKYFFDGKEISNITENQLARIRNRNIGFVFQNFNLLPRLTAFANVELPLVYQRVNSEERKKAVKNALDRVGLIDRAMHKPNQLSGGQQQRVAIARAIVTNPSLLLADEPTGNLDTKTGNEIMDLFHELHDGGRTIILITHNDVIATQMQRRINIIDGHVSEGI